MAVVGCELVSPDYCNRVDWRMEEKGERCYRRSDGNMYCVDKNGNRTY